MVKKSSNKKLSVTEDILLIEYQKAQDSAEHHDNLIWIFFGLFVGGLGGVIKFAFSHRELQPYISIFGIFLVLAGASFIRGFRFYKNKKYERCRDIEDHFFKKYNGEILSPMQHSFVHEEKEKHCKLFLGGIEIICAVLLIVLLIFLVLLVEHQTFFQWSMIHLIIRHSGRIAILLGILAFIIYFKSGKIRKFFERYLYNRIVVGALILSLMATGIPVSESPFFSLIIWSAFSACLRA